MTKCNEHPMAAGDHPLCQWQHSHHVPEAGAQKRLEIPGKSDSDPTGGWGGRNGAARIHAAEATGIARETGNGELAAACQALPRALGR